MRQYNILHSALLLLLVVLAADAGESMQQGFLKVAGWKADVSVTRFSYNGEMDELTILRDAARLPETRVSSAAVPVKDGIWQVLGNVSCELYSPDMSFNCELIIKWLDKKRKFLEHSRVRIWTDKQGSKDFSQTVVTAEGAAYAQLVMQINKSHGKVIMHGLKMRRIGERKSMPGGDRIVSFSSNATGFMFYPQQPVIIKIRVETPLEINSEELKKPIGTWLLTDYWGSEQFMSDSVRGIDKLCLGAIGKNAKGWNVYSGNITIDALPLLSGKYYELHTRIRLGDSEDACDNISFAVLPEAAANEFSAAVIPFGSHTWDARLKDYFELSSRIGLRRCLVFWGIEPGEENGAQGITPGSFKEKYTLGWPEKFGIRPYAMWYPLFNIERGKYEYEAGLAEGLRKAVSIGKDRGLWGFQIGNEPPHWNGNMVDRDVSAYRTAYEAIKAADPDMFVIGSAIGPVEDFFKKGFQNYCDAFNIHAYSDVGELRAAMRKYRELFARYGGEKPVYSTEIGSKSQGLSRQQIAGDLIRKAACFFADGGAFFTWFAITYPDPSGKRRGSYGDSMDLFAGYLNMYSPRLDAIAYYHLVNSLLDKKFVQEKIYPHGEHAILFRNSSGRCLLVLWNDSSGQRDMFLPINGAGQVRVTAIDGTESYLDSYETGVTLRVGADPLLVSFQGKHFSLPAKLPDSEIKFSGMTGKLAPGENATLSFSCPAIYMSTFDSSAAQAGNDSYGDVVASLSNTNSLQRSKKILSLAVPAGWKVEKLSGNEVGTISFKVSAPELTSAREVLFRAHIGKEGQLPQGVLDMRLPLLEKISLNIVPQANITKDKTGKAVSVPALRMVLQNNTTRMQSIHWSVSIEGEVRMKSGAYSFSSPLLPSASIDGESTGELSLAPDEIRSIILPLKNIDRLSIYQIAAEAVIAGRAPVHFKRLAGGFAGVPMRRNPLDAAGMPDGSDWNNSPWVFIDEERQYYHDHTMSAGKWNGEGDLSGRVQFLWDVDNLYLRCVVNDDIFANPGSNNTLWRMDGLQMLINPFRQEAETRGRYDIALGLGQQGVQAWRHMSASPHAPTGEASDIIVDVKHAENGNITYTVAIPWKSLAPFTPKVGANLGLSLIINEDDSEGRCGFMGWFGGVHLKEVNHVGDLVLCQ